MLLFSLVIASYQELVTQLIRDRADVRHRPGAGDHLRPDIIAGVELSWAKLSKFRNKFGFIQFGNKNLIKLALS